MYQRPYTTEEIKKHYPERADMLLKDPVHLWRVETGIELIHKEPTKDEQVRIWNNWLEMPREFQEKSDKKSLELFGISNRIHHEKIMSEYENRY